MQVPPHRLLVLPGGARPSHTGTGGRGGSRLWPMSSDCVISTMEPQPQRWPRTKVLGSVCGMKGEWSRRMRTRHVTTHFRGHMLGVPIVQIWDSSPAGPTIPPLTRTEIGEPLWSDHYRQ